MNRIHINIPVKDINNSIKFYQHLFNRPVSKQRDDYANFRLDTPPIHLALVASKQNKNESTMQHFGVELNDHDELQQWKSHLRQANITFKDQPDVECCYAKGDKLWVNDPDNYSWEIWVRTGETEGLACSQAKCCA